VRYDVFISYSSIDQEVADDLFRTLEGAGINCWMARSHISAGSVWGKEIAAALEGSRSLVCILSQAAVESEWVQNEVAEAQDARLPIFPYLIQRVPLPGELRLRLKRVQWIDATGDPASAKQSLTEAIRVMVASQEARNSPCSAHEVAPPEAVPREVQEEGHNVETEMVPAAWYPSETVEDEPIAAAAPTSESAETPLEQAVTSAHVPAPRSYGMPPPSGEWGFESAGFNAGCTGVIVGGIGVLAFIGSFYPQGPWYVFAVFAAMGAVYMGTGSTVMMCIVRNPSRLRTSGKNLKMSPEGMTVDLDGVGLVTVPWSEVVSARKRGIYGIAVRVTGGGPASRMLLDQTPTHVDERTLFIGPFPGESAKNLPDSLARWIEYGRNVLPTAPIADC
jgi:hypothetical protein